MDERIPLVAGLTPAIATSNPHFAVFYFLQADDLQEGRYEQGCEGRINMMTPQQYTLPSGRTVLLPSLQVESRGRVAVSPRIHEVYFGHEGIERFFAQRPTFEIYQPFIHDFMHPYIEEDKRQLSA